MNLQITYLLWPVRVGGVSEGWIYGTYRHLKGLPTRELLEKKRLKAVRLKREILSESQVRDSLLCYEALGMALEGNRILLETGQIDQQQFCEPRALASELRVEQALVEFMNLEDGDDNAAVEFMKEFGEFDHLELDEENQFVDSDIPQTVQKICKGYIRKQEDPFVVSLNDFWAVRRDIKGLWNLAEALGRKDRQRVRDECIRRRPNSTSYPEPNWLAVGKAILCADLSASLNPGKGNPRMILSEKDGKLIALTMGTTVRSALYLTLLDMIVSRTPYRSCPNCKKYFIVTVKRKQYCTEVCQNTAKVRRFRDKQKGKSAPVLTARRKGASPLR